MYTKNTNIIIFSYFENSQDDSTKAHTLLNYQPEYIISVGMSNSMDRYIKSLAK